MAPPDLPHPHPVLHARVWAGGGILVKAAVCRLRLPLRLLSAPVDGLGPVGASAAPLPVLSRLPTTNVARRSALLVCALLVLKLVPSVVFSVSPTITNVSTPLVNFNLAVVAPLFIPNWIALLLKVLGTLGVRKDHAVFTHAQPVTKCRATTLTAKSFKLGEYYGDRHDMDFISD